MDPLDTYAAPDAVPTDLAREASSIPRMFKATLVVLVLLQMLTVIAMPTSSSIVLFGVTALAAWKTLQHHRAASRLLAVFLVLDALMFYATASGLALHRLAAGGVMFALAICALGSAAYLFFSPSMRAVFRKTETTKWSSG
jgi:hypothetical protein